jgi:hypothetical protein
MGGFRVRCPKCGSQRVDVTRDRSNGWANIAQAGVTWLHCGSCGKDLYAKVAEEEVEQQLAKWQANPPGPQELTEAERVRLAVESAREALLVRSNAEVAANIREIGDIADRCSTFRDRARAVKARHGANGLDFQCVLNRVEIEVNSLGRLVVEVAGRSTPAFVRAKLLEARATAAVLPRHLAEVERLAVAETGLPPQAEPVPVKCAWKDCENLPRLDSAYCSLDCRNKNARWRHDVRKGKVAHDGPLPPNLTRPD